MEHQSSHNEEPLVSPAVYFWGKLLVAALFVAAVIGIAVQVGELLQEYERARAAAIETGNSLTNDIAEHFRERAKQLIEQTQAIADALESGEINQGNLLERLKAETLKDPSLLGFTVAYEPFAWSPDRRLYSPYYDSPRDQFIYLGELYDYTDPSKREDAIWYQVVAESGEPQWVAAYGPGAQSTYAGYSVPFYTKDDDAERRLAGVVNVAISLDALRDLLNTRFVGRLGAGIMVNHEGVVLASPNKEHMRAGRTYEQVVRESPGGNEEKYQVARDMAAGKRGYYRFLNYGGLKTPQSGWFFYQPLEPSDWRMGIAIFDSELVRNATTIRRLWIGIAVSTLACITMLPLLLLRRKRSNLPATILSVLAFSLGGLAVVAFLWSLSLNRPTYAARDNGRYQTVTDQQRLNVFVNERCELAEKTHASPAKIVPTRILIDGIRLESHDRANVSGKVWQRYSKKDHEGIARGIKFANVLPDAEALYLEEIYRDESEKEELICWEFRAALRQHLAFRRFPFDIQRVVVALQHPNESRNILLVPDLNAFRMLNSSVQPGIERGVEIPGWSTRASYFGFMSSPQVVETGISDREEMGDRIDLQFHVVVQRSFLSPFISFVVPILIVIGLVYGVVLLSSINQDKQSATGFNVFGVLGTCGAFFFTIAMMHIDLRRNIHADVITYLESLYLISYVLLLTVTLNSLLLITTDFIGFIEYRDNLVAKLAYWPLFALFVLVVTLFTFY